MSPEWSARPHSSALVCVRVALNGERYPPFTVHRSPGDGSEAELQPTCCAHTSGSLTHAC
eukprot:362095-Chlamydomonas_euryale.AAC.2